MPNRNTANAHWTRRTHLLRADEYICSRCRRSFAQPTAFCPACGAQMGKTKSDAHWLLEAEVLNMIMDDEEW